MSLEVINTAASVGTLLVISATAIAAIVLLRHLLAERSNSVPLRDRRSQTEKT